MPMPRVFVTRQILPQALELLESVAEVEVWPEEYPPSPADLRQKLSDADGVFITVMDRVDGLLLDAAPKLRVISQLAVGLDNVDVAAATKRGIPVGYTPGVLAKSTADLAFALLMCAARGITQNERTLRSGEWKIAHHPMHWLGTDIHDATLGIIGLGQIGLEMAKRARGFDMKLIYHSRTRRPELEAEYGLEYADLPTLLGAADFVSLHMPLVPETRHYIGEAQLRMMKTTSILINTARGPVVDSKALYTALKEGWIRAASLDVTDPEPIPIDDPLLTLDNLVITPHMGSAAIPTRRNTMLLAARNVLAGLAGERLETCANTEVYDTK